MENWTQDNYFIVDTRLKNAFDVVLKGREGLQGRNFYYPDEDEKYAATNLFFLLFNCSYISPGLPHSGNAPKMLILKNSFTGMIVNITMKFFWNKPEICRERVHTMVKREQFFH